MNTYCVPCKKMNNNRPDKHTLYERSVQTPSADAQFIRRIFKKLRGRTPLTLREDFCGTAALCCEWVKAGSSAIAYGIDLHKPTLDWGRRQHVSRLGPRGSRVHLIQGDVLDNLNVRTDTAAAFNFSYFCFKERPLLLRYCRSVHNALVPDGLFFLDIYGGPDSYKVQKEETDHGDFTYVWDQARVNPVTGEVLNHIHFELADGRKVQRAFTYDWRLWSIPEVTDVLLESGFSHVQVYWEGTDTKTGDGNGVFRLSRKGDDSDAYIAYLVGIK